MSMFERDEPLFEVWTETRREDESGFGIGSQLMTSKEIIELIKLDGNVKVTSFDPTEHFKIGGFK